MTEINKAGWRVLRSALAATLLVGVAGCGPGDPPASVSLPQSGLRIGYGLSSGENSQTGIRQAVSNIALEALIWFTPDGRPQPWLAESWDYSQDGLTLRVRLRSGVAFHDGTAVTAGAVREILMQQLPEYIGVAFTDIRTMNVLSDLELELVLNRRSAWVLEGLELPIQRGKGFPVGTGPFRLRPLVGQNIEMEANPLYYGGKPRINHIRFNPYTSVRSAWADLLRNDVDMLYEVGVDAMDFVQQSGATDVFTFRRPYPYLVLLNLAKPKLQDRKFRQALNAAVDRNAIVSEGLKGYGNPADGPVWPLHWAYDPAVQRFRYDPHPVANGGAPIQLRCLISDRSLERLALLLQRQLRAVGVDLVLETSSIDEAMARFQSGDFEAVLADARQGPTIVKPYMFWHSTSPLNWGRYSSPAVDAALDAIRGAENADAYKAGVAAFERAIIDDPPAIFLAWTQRARAVSKRFEVADEPGRDIVRTLSKWRPAAQTVALSN